MVLRICVWALAVIATVGNILVIACRARYKHCNQVIVIGIFIMIRWPLPESVLSQFAVGALLSHNQSCAGRSPNGFLPFADRRGGLALPRSLLHSRF